MRNDPIARRHANHRDIACPMFWRRFGVWVALLLAVNPWIAAPLILVADNLANNRWIGEFRDLVMPALLVSVFLLLSGLAWFGTMLAAWRNGCVNGWLFCVCLILGFGGIVAVFLALVAARWF